MPILAGVALGACRAAKRRARKTPLNLFGIFLQTIVDARAPRIVVIMLSLNFAPTACAQAEAAQQKWAASWTTAISGPLKKLDLPAGLPPAMVAAIKVQLPQHEFDFAMPDGRADDQSFRMIVKPDLWGDTVRLRFSNMFGDQDMLISAAAVGLQQYAGVLLPGSNTLVTFGGKAGITIPVGRTAFSDPVHLPFVTAKNKASLIGRNLAVSFAIPGKSGALSTHFSGIHSYISNPKAGDRTRDEDDFAYPNLTDTYLLLSELDVMAPADTRVICAFGDSITDPISSTDGRDGWPDDLSERLHQAYGDKVSVVNSAIGGNTVVVKLPGPAATDTAVDRLDRDVLSISGLTDVVWLEGINDLGTGQSRPEPVIEGYRRVVEELHAKNIAAMGATLTPSLWPDQSFADAPFGAVTAAQYGKPQTDSYRKQLNDFIRHSGVFDSVADMAKATEDPATGGLYKNFQSGDWLHPNRAGHLAMAASVDLAALMHARQ